MRREVDGGIREPWRALRLPFRVHSDLRKLSQDHCTYFAGRATNGRQERHMTAYGDQSTDSSTASSEAILRDQRGAPGKIRTCDTRFRKPMLYPLSYEGARL